MVGTGATLGLVEKLAIDATNSKLYAIDETIVGILEVDIATGNRSTLSSSGVGSGTNFKHLSDIKINSTSTKLYVSDLNLGNIIEVDIATGNRTDLISSRIGAGNAIDSPFSLYKFKPVLFPIQICFKRSS